MATTNTKSRKQERAVVVTTKHKGVFFGYAADVDGDVIQLRAARNCLYWTSDVRGFMGLASAGPSKGCRVGPAADIQLRDITAVVLATDAAVAAWEAAPWR